MLNSSSPKQLKQISSSILAIIWRDGHESAISLRHVRDSCPCAGCKGESVLFQTYVPPPPDIETTGRYELRKAVPVGNYGVKFTWGDTHDMGMYTWDHLRKLCECDVCKSERVQD